MPFFRVRTAFSGPPVIPHCKDIRFRVIAGYPDYGSSYHFYGIVRRRPQKGCFLRLYLAAVPSHAVRFCHPFPVRLVRLLLFLPSVPASAVCFCFCFCCSVPFPCLFLSPPSAFASAVRSRPRRLFPLVPSASPALCRATKKPAAITGPQAFRSRRFSPSGSAIRLRARIRRCRKFCSDWG